MKLPPLPQQVTITKFILDHHEAAIDAGMGLGKTRATLDAIDFLINDCAIKGVLIVSPLWVSILTWPAEIARWAPHLRYVSLRTEEGMKAWREGTADIYLINFEMLQTFEKNGLLKRKSIAADMLVIDEISKFRDPSSKRAKVVKTHRRHFRRCVGLTGTPVPNSHLDLWGQYRVMDGGVRLGTAFSRFRSRFFESDYMGYSFTIRPGAKEMIEQSIADITLVMRSEDYLNIPPTTVVDVDVAIPDAARKVYKTLEKELLAEVSDKEVVALSAATLVTKLRQVTSGAVISEDGVVWVHDAKVDALKKLHKDLKQRPLLVATNYIHERDRILAAIPCAQEFDAKRLDDWNAGKIPMWVVHVNSVSHGLQMQGTCCEIAWFSLNYSNEIFMQLNARVARTGQTRPTTVYRLMVPDSIDWAMADVLESKNLNEQGMLKNLVANIKLLAELRKSS